MRHHQIFTYLVTHIYELEVLLKNDNHEPLISTDGYLYQYDYRGLIKSLTEI